jgi:hypothetical protein
MTGDVEEGSNAVVTPPEIPRINHGSMRPRLPDALVSEGRQMR